MALRAIHDIFRPQTNGEPLSPSNTVKWVADLPIEPRYLFYIAARMIQLGTRKLAIGIGRRVAMLIELVPLGMLALYFDARDPLTSLRPVTLQACLLSSYFRTASIYGGEMTLGQILPHQITGGAAALTQKAAASAVRYRGRDGPGGDIQTQTAPRCAPSNIHQGTTPGHCPGLCCLNAVAIKRRREQQSRSSPIFDDFATSGEEIPPRSSRAVLCRRREWGQPPGRY